MNQPGPLLLMRQFRCRRSISPQDATRYVHDVTGQRRGSFVASSASTYFIAAFDVLVSKPMAELPYACVCKWKQYPWRASSNVDRLLPRDAYPAYTQRIVQNVIGSVSVSPSVARRYLYVKIGSVCPSVCATVSASFNPLPSDRLRCCDRYIRCRRSLAVKPLNSQPAISGSPCHRRSVRTMSRYQFTHVRYRTV